MLEYFLLSRLSTNNMLFDSLIVLLLIPLVSYLVSYIKDDGTTIIRNYINNRYNKIIFIGWDNFINGVYCFDYPYPMLAICHYIIKNNLSNKIRQFNHERNKIFDMYDLNNFKVNKEDIKYILDSSHNIKLLDDIYVDFSIQKVNNDISQKDKTSNSNWKVTLLIKSMTKSIQEIKDFIKKITKEYNEYDKMKNENKIYHFIYQGMERDCDKMKFTQSVLSNFENESEKNYETFDTIFSEHKDTLIKTMKRLKDYEYFKRTGSKRKAGFLFHGPPGCGKTCHVNAIANYDKRHIIEIPMSRIKTNKELENIINLTEINEVTFNKEEIILFFDEIDQAGKILSKRDGEEEIEKKDEVKDLMILSLLNKNSGNDNNTFNNKDDDLNLGCVLSRLDGIGNYNGLILIASTNCKDNLSPALYRSGRLSPLYFDYSRKVDIINMIEYNYNIKLTEEQLSKLPDRTHAISPATLRKYIDEEPSYEKLINFLNQKIK